jgi:hypothetical protein
MIARSLDRWRHSLVLAWLDGVTLVVHTFVRRSRRSRRAGGRLLRAGVVPRLLLLLAGVRKRRQTAAQRRARAQRSELDAAPSSYLLAGCCTSYCTSARC